MSIPQMPVPQPRSKVRGFVILWRGALWSLLLNATRKILWKTSILSSSVSNEGQLFTPWWAIYERGRGQGQKTHLVDGEHIVPPSKCAIPPAILKENFAVSVGLGYNATA
jgi:hypothetical protein